MSETRRLNTWTEAGKLYTRVLKAVPSNFKQLEISIDTGNLTNKLFVATNPAIELNAVYNYIFDNIHLIKLVYVDSKLIYRKGE